MCLIVRDCSDRASADCLVRAVSVDLNRRPLIQGIIQYPIRAIPSNTVIREVRTEITIIPFHLPSPNPQGAFSSIYLGIYLSSWSKFPDFVGALSVTGAP